MQNGKVVGTVTSSGWGHRVDKNLAYAFVDPETDADLSVLMLGSEVPAQVCNMSFMIQIMLWCDKTEKLMYILRLAFSLEFPQFNDLK